MSAVTAILFHDAWSSLQTIAFVGVVAYWSFILLEHRLPRRTPPISQIDELRCVSELRFWSSIKQKSFKRSYDLLLSSLSEAQRKSFLERGWFEVRGSQSKKRYQILARTVFNVRQGNCSYCVQVADRDIPFFDELLTQKLVLEFDEPRFLKIANKGPTY